MIYAVVADFVWNTLVEVFMTSVELPGDSALYLSPDAYMAEFPSEVEEIHGMVFIGSTLAVEQPGVLVGDIQPIGKHWSTTTSSR